MSVCLGEVYECIVCLCVLCIPTEKRAKGELDGEVLALFEGSCEIPTRAQRQYTLAHIRRYIQTNWWVTKRKDPTVITRKRASSSDSNSKSRAGLF